MPTTQAFVSGRQVTVDNEQFNIKFTKTVEQLNAGLTKAQKALGLFYDENQRLNDGLGRCVEGLSTWQIKLGMWIDDTGKARTVAGGFAEGLSRADLELGRYINDLGEVRSKTDEFVRKTEALIQAEKAEADAMRETREAFASAFDALGDGSGRFALLLSQLDGLNERTAGLQSRLMKLSGAVDAASQTFATLRSVGAGLESVKKSIVAMDAAMKASATTAQGLKAVLATLGGPWTIIAAGVASAVAAITLFNDETEKASEKTVEAGEKIADSFEKVKARAKEAGDEIRGLNDVLKYGAFYKEDNSLESLEADLKKKDEDLAKLKAERDKAQDAARNTTASGPSAGTAQAAAWKEVDKWNAKVAEAQQARDKVEAQYNEIATPLIQKLREEQQTEEQKANALKEQYQTLLERAQTDDDRAAIEAKIKSIDDGIAESKRKELETQQKKLADQRAALAKDLGISFDFSPVKTQEETLADDLKKLRDAFNADPEMFDGVENALEEAEARIRQKYSDESLASFSASLGKIDSTATEQAAPELRQLRNNKVANCRKNARNEALKGKSLIYLSCV